MWGKGHLEKGPSPTLNCLDEGKKGEFDLSPRKSSMAQHALPTAEGIVESQDVLSASLLVVSGQTHAARLWIYPFLLKLHTCRMQWRWEDHRIPSV